MEEPTNDPEISLSLDELFSESFDDFDEPLYSRGYFDDAEDREQYKPGGLHPVHLGDHLGKDNQFRVIHKLGNGGLSTVWFCRDSEKNRYVALKIIIADASSDDCAELKLVHRKGLDFNQAGGEHIVLPLDYFWTEGPNGSHLCLVLPVLGPRVPVIWHTFPDPSKTARDISLQVTRGLQFLHRNGICHGDFRPSNILLRLSNLDSLSEEEITRELREPQMEPVFTVSGETPGLSAPKYIVQPLDLEALNPKYLTDQACIIDFGESYDLSNPPEGLGIPLGYCSPELIFDSSVGIGSDIWALACTLYELRSMSRLFDTFNGTDDEVVLQMVRLLGKLPEPWWSSWEARHRWFNEDGNPATGVALGRSRTLEELLQPGVHFSIDRRQIDIIVPPVERAIFSDLLLQMLKYDPHSRPTVESVLKHSWLKP